jgi:hypothetical protein
LIFGSYSSLGVAGAESDAKVLSEVAASLRKRFWEAVLRHWEDGPDSVTGDSKEGLEAGVVAHANRSVQTASAWSRVIRPTSIWVVLSAAKTLRLPIPITARKTQAGTCRVRLDSNSGVFDRVGRV